MNKPIISVIVTDHNRKDFLIECLKSVIEQELPRDLYEIIVVKNFIDDPIDNFIKKNNIKNLYTDTTNIGEKFVIGAENSNGNILSILNDDDKFTKDKLKYIYNIFTTNENLVYYHNSFIEINEKSELTQHKIILSNININSETLNIKSLRTVLTGFNTFNDSCITIKKEVILRNWKVLQSVSGNQDIILFFLSLLNKGLLIFDSKQLTYFRIHNSTSQLLVSELDSSILKFNALIEKRTKSFEGIIGLFKDEWYYSFIECFYMSNKLQKSLFTHNKKRDVLKLEFTFMKCPFYSSFKTRTILIFLVILTLLDNDFIKKFIAKLLFKYY